MRETETRKSSHPQAHVASCERHVDISAGFQRSTLAIEFRTERMSSRAVRVTPCHGKSNTHARPCWSSRAIVIIGPDFPFQLWRHPEVPLPFLLRLSAFKFMEFLTSPRTEVRI